MRKERVKTSILSVCYPHLCAIIYDAMYRLRKLAVIGHDANVSIWQMPKALWLKKAK
jgi:hypothetical protein